MHEVIMPKLGLTMETGTIEKWLKKEGDVIEEGDILFEVMTDKVSLEVESYNSGILRKIIHFEGEEVPVTDIVAYIGGADEKIPETEPDAKISQKELSIKKIKDINIQDKNSDSNKISEKSHSDKKVFITPLARKKAKELEIDYKTVEINGSGPRGRILQDDIIKYNESELRQEKSRSILPIGSEISGNYQNIVLRSFRLRGIRKIIADKMTISNQTIPHIIISAVADVNELMILKGKIQKKALDLFQVKLTFTDFIIKAAAMALRENIGLNSKIAEEEVSILEDINIGIAVSSENGLVVPTILRTDTLSLIEIAKRRTEIIEKARNNNLLFDDLSNGTFTISNLGMFRVRSFTAIINPPQSSILSVGEIYKDIFFDENENIKAGNFMNLSIAVDHRIIDGADAAKFIQSLLGYLENPYFVF